MPLTRVTITGADNGVDPKDLVALSRSFPFVEWGILRSDNRQNIPRYPDWRWRDELHYASDRGGRVNLAMHFCGRLARDVMAGDHSVVDTNCSRYRRVQLNGWSQYRLPGLNVAMNDWHREYIAQATNEQAFVDACQFVLSHGYKRVSVLWDPSGGRGFHAPFSGKLDPGVKVGFAGGIHADNVQYTLDQLSGFEVPFWIDMESGVRTDDRFDLTKVTRVLERTAPYVYQG
jgi:hypothetical protein